MNAPWWRPVAGALLIACVILGVTAVLTGFSGDAIGLVATVLAFVVAAIGLVVQVISAREPGDPPSAREAATGGTTSVTVTKSPGARISIGARSSGVTAFLTLVVVLFAIVIAYQGWFLLHDSDPFPKAAVPPTADGTPAPGNPSSGNQPSGNREPTPTTDTAPTASEKPFRAPPESAPSSPSPKASSPSKARPLDSGSIYCQRQVAVTSGGRDLDNFCPPDYSYEELIYEPGSGIRNSKSLAWRRMSSGTTPTQRECESALNGGGASGGAVMATAAGQAFCMTTNQDRTAYVRVSSMGSESASVFVVVWRKHENDVAAVR